MIKHESGKICVPVSIKKLFLLSLLCTGTLDMSILTVTLCIYLGMHPGPPLRVPGGLSGPNIRAPHIHTLKIRTIRPNTQVSTVHYYFYRKIFQYT